MHRLQQFLRPNNYLLWIVLAIGFKLLQTILFAPTIRTVGDNYYAALGDTPFYVDATKTIMNEGEYYYNRHEVFFGPVRNIKEDNDPPELHSKIYTYRMPGYPIFMLPFLSVFDIDTGLDIVALFQLLFAAVSVYFLAYIMFIFTENRWAFYAAFFLYLLSFYVAKWSTYIMTESFSLSMLITLFLFCALIFKRKKFSLFWYILVGCGITVAIFMRPFFIPFYGLMVLYLLWLAYKKRITIAAFVLFVAPTVLSEAAWVIRNKIVTDRFVLLEDTLSYFDIGNQTLKEWTGFVISIGGSKLYWEGQSHGRWMLPTTYFDAEGSKRPSDEIWPEWLRKDTARFEKMKQIRERYEISLDSTLDLNYRLELEQQNIQDIKELKAYVKSEKPFLFYVERRWIIFKDFINQVNDVSYNSIRFPFNILYSIIGPTINVLVMFCGPLAMLGFFILYNKKLTEVNPVIFTIYFIPAFLIFFLQIIMGATENRHLTFMYPFFLFGLVHFNWAVFQKHKLAGYALTGLITLVAAGSAVYQLLYYVKW